MGVEPRPCVLRVPLEPQSASAQAEAVPPGVHVTKHPRSSEAGDVIRQQYLEVADRVLLGIVAPRVPVEPFTTIDAHANAVTGLVEDGVRRRIPASVDGRTDEPRLRLAPIGPRDRVAVRHETQSEAIAREQPDDLGRRHLVQRQHLGALRRLHVVAFWRMVRVSPNRERDLDRVASFLEAATSVLFVTGAGISADSGIPTYRGIGGLYDDIDTPEGLPIEEVLSGAMMRRDPALVWRYLHEIERASRGASENEAHRVVAEAERRLERVWVLTQNVDGLHRKAGSRNVIDIHGDVHRLYCTACGLRSVVDDFGELDALPFCPDCRKPLRPDVVLFGELLPESKVRLMERELFVGFDVVFSIGTTSVFPYIVRPVIEAKLNGMATVEINPGETVLSDQVDVKLDMGAAHALREIRDRLQWRESSGRSRGWG